MPEMNTVHIATGLPSKGQGTGSSSEFQFQGSDSKGCKLYLPGTYRLKNSLFDVRLMGRVTTSATTTNFTLQLYWGVSATISDNTSIATTSTVAANSSAIRSSNFMLIAHLMYDSTSQRLGGEYSIVHTLQSPAIIARAVITSGGPTGVDMSAENLGFTATGTFSDTTAGNTAYLDRFELCLI